MKELIRNRIARRVAYLLPWRVMYFVIIRTWAHTTTHECSHKTPDETTWSDVIKSWEEKCCKI